MPFRTLAVAALAALFVLGAPLAAHADVSHDSTLSGTTAQVTVDAEPANAGLKASVEILHVGARYSAPTAADIVYLNEYTLDAAGKVAFSAVIPGGALDDYVIAVKVAGATSRYLASLDPAGPVPVDPSGGGAAGGVPGGTGPSGAGDPLAITGVTVAIGTVSLLALAAVILGAVLLVRRRRSQP